MRRSSRPTKLHSKTCSLLLKSWIPPSLDGHSPVVKWKLLGSVVGVVVRLIVNAAVGGLALTGHVVDHGVDIDLDTLPCGTW
mgnify:CR=1 FL=1